MSAAAQAVSHSATPPPQSARSAAKDLRALLPYIAQYKGSVALGMLMNIGLGITGVLAPILTGAIFDTLSRAPVPHGKIGARRPICARPAADIITIREAAQTLGDFLHRAVWPRSR